MTVLTWPVTVWTLVYTAVGESVGLELDVAVFGGLVELVDATLGEDSCVMVSI